METVKFDKSLKITNINQLPSGLNCKFLLAMKAHNGDYVAHSWKRVKPSTIPDGYVLIVFGK